jgi:hypothetical protein
MSSNYNLEGLALDDFTRLHSLEGIQSAPNLKHLHFGNAAWDTSTLTDLQPLAGSGLISFSFGGKAIENNDIFVYTKMPALKFLNFASNLYSTEQLAQIVALCPEISGFALSAYIKFKRTGEHEKDVLICGKRKPFLNSEKDAAKIEAYVKNFNSLVEKYKREPPEENLCTKTF